MTKSRMIYILALAVALVVLIWDKTSPRVALTGPSSLQAQGEGAPSPSETDSTQNIDITWGHNLPHPIDLLPENSLSGPDVTVENFFDSDMLEKLPAYTGDSTAPPGEPPPVRDLFAASEKFLEILGQTAPEKERQNRGEQLQQLKLSGIAITSEFSCALINEEIVFLGENIGPFHLREIACDHVVLEADTQLISVYLDQ